MRPRTWAAFCVLWTVLSCVMTWACLPRAAVLLNEASDLFAKHRYTEAAAAYRQAAELAPSWSAPQLGLGNALRELGDRAGALFAYRRAVELAPASNDAQIALAALLLEAGRWADAERQLRAALKEIPRDGRLHAMLGFALSKQQRESEALLAFERSLEMCKRCMTDEETAAYQLITRRSR